MLLAIIPQGSGATGLDTANSVADAIYRLGFGSAADMNTDQWVTTAELLQFADDAARRLAWKHGVFLVWDTSITVTSGTALYNEPATHVFTVVACLVFANSTIQLLRPTPVRDLWALDSTWPTTTGNATRCSLDAGGVGTITLYPNPLAGGTLGQVVQEYPATVQAGNTTLELPSVLQDYFTYAMLRAARGKESPNQLRDMYQHYDQRCRLYEQVIDHLWGAGQ